MPEQPTGTITFLFTDIEGSTVRWERFPDTMRTAVARHDEIMRSLMETHDGIIFKTMGDAFYVAFASAGKAILAAIEAQQALAAEVWHEDISPIRVRMALHTGEAQLRDNDYFGQTLNRVARLLSAGHGGQILLSQITATLVRDLLPVDISLRDLGEHRLKDIHHPEHIFQVEIRGFQNDFLPLKTLDRHPNNLPTQLTPFVGREDDLDSVCHLLLDEHIRLVTLVGPGGTGKTRLSLQVAATVADTFPDGLYYVELASICEPGEVLSVIAQTIGVSETGEAEILEKLCTHLNGMVLLVLDNFEHIMDAAPLVTELLRTCRQLKILTTSRAPLRLEGEHEYHVPPLAVPDLKPPFDLDKVSQYAAIALFVQQANAVKPYFQLTEENVAAVIEICARLDGLPLAIELAAARINLLPPQAMLKRLDNRLKLLTSGERNRAERQQTLRNAIAWSYEALDTQERILFEQLAIFNKGCTLEAIETVCVPCEDLNDDILDILHSLLEKSLVRQHEQPGGEPRFEMLETIREFAFERLSQTEMSVVMRQRHADYYLHLGEEIAPTLTGTEQKFWLNRLKKERENMKDALKLFTEQRQCEMGLRLATALWRFWLLGGDIDEGRHWFKKLLDMTTSIPVADPVKARALQSACILAMNQNDQERAATLAEEALQVSQQLQDQELLGGAYVTLADVAFARGESQRAATLLQESLRIRRALGDKRGTATLLNNLGNVALKHGQLDQAMLLHRESLELFREVGDEYAIATTLNNLGDIERQREHYEQAIVLYSEGLQHCQALGYIPGTAISLTNLGDMAYSCANYDRAADLYKEALALFRDLDDQCGIVLCLAGLAEVAYTQNQLERSVRLFAQAKYISVTGRNTLSCYSDSKHEPTLTALREELGVTSFDAFWHVGWVLQQDKAVTEALSSATPS